MNHQPILIKRSMYKKLFFIIALPLVIFSCLKKSPSSDCGYSTPTTTASAAEIANLKTYLDTNSFTYTQHPSGIFYNIVTPGSESITPAICSNVLVKYSGRLTTSTTPFDQNTAGVAFTLGGLIKGWQYGIPLIKKGGSIILYIPPSLGYGARGSGAAIPPNSNLIFTINLLDVQ